METLLSQFSFLSDQALHDKSFDPKTIEDLMKLFELEAYKSWASMELEQEKEAENAKISMREAEDYLDSVMESAMQEFRSFEEELERKVNKELHGLLYEAEKERKEGKLMEEVATIASEKYIVAAVNSGMASMKSAAGFKRIHPS
ncbi:hypothetical protein RJ641_018881 [Dillenia turbinata]|uniref:Uncharacterized protein n=1 Tax=Dillenia turbinata TaxID=194707 RepID=A0AAN8YXM6_9MAGN